MFGKLLIWEPVENCSERFYFKVLQLHDSNEGLSIQIEYFENKKSEIFVITFEYNYAYRVSDESYLLNSPLIYKLPAFFRVKKSQFLDWFNSENDDAFAQENITHFGIYTADLCIDVLSNLKPKVSKLTASGNLR